MTPNPALDRALADDRPVFAPPLDIAMDIAREVLGAAHRAQFAAQLTPAVAAYHMGSAIQALRSLLAAVTAEVYGPPDEEREVRIPGQRPPSPHSGTGAAE